MQALLPTLEAALPSRGPQHVLEHLTTAMHRLTAIKQWAVAAFRLVSGPDAPSARCGIAVHVRPD